MPSPLVPLLLTALAVSVPALAEEPVAVTSSIVEVTVYPGAASVRRRAELPGADGRYPCAVPGVSRVL